MEYKANSNRDILYNIVDRCHVSTSNLALIRYAISRFKHKYKTWQTFAKKERRETIRILLNRHKTNQELYRDVVNGNL